MKTKLFFMSMLLMVSVGSAQWKGLFSNEVSPFTCIRI